jgi:glycoside/pentoside/hexuronide:cation symporter, GPH family
MDSSPPAVSRHSSLRLIAYASPAIPIAALGVPLAVYLPNFYAGPMRLGLATVGTIFMIARLWDVVIDPLIGAWSDRFPSRWGRRRHWMVLSVPILMVSGYFVFMPRGQVSAQYLLIGLLVLYLGYTMILLAHMSWGAELDDDYHERSRVQAYREGLSSLGVPLVLLLPAFIEKLGGPSMSTARVAAMGWFLILTLPVAVLLAVLTVGERTGGVQPKFTLAQMISPILTNRALRLVVTADFASGFSLSALGAMFIYEATDYLDVGHYSSLLLLLYFIAGAGFIPILLRLSYRFGKHRTVTGAAIFNIITAPAPLLVPKGSLLIAAPLVMFLGVNIGSLTVLFRSMMADVADFDEVRTGRRQVGLFYSLLTFSANVGSAVAIGIVYWALALIGFSPRGVNTAGSIRALNLTFILIPIICNLVVVLVMRNFPIGQKEQRELRAVLDRRVAETRETDSAAPAATDVRRAQVGS